MKYKIRNISDYTESHKNFDLFSDNNDIFSKVVKEYTKNVDEFIRNEIKLMLFKMFGIVAATANVTQLINTMENKNVIMTIDDGELSHNYETHSFKVGLPTVKFYKLI